MFVANSDAAMTIQLTPRPARKGASADLRLIRNVVGFDERSRFRVDQSGDVLLEEFLAQLEIACLARPAEELGGAEHHCGESEIPEAKVGHGANELDEVSG